MARFRSAIWQPALLSKPVSGYLLVVLSVASGMGLAGFAGTFEFARKEQVQGYLAPAAGWARVAAESSGVVRRRFVDPGGLVRSGDVLLEISPGNGLQRAQTVQDRMLEEIEGRRGTLMARLRLTASEYEQDVALLVQQNASDSQNLARLEGEVALSQARARIARKRYQDGQQLAASGALPKAELVLLEEEVQARLFVPPAAMGFVEPGQEVRVYIDAFPYERHGAQLG